MRYFAKLRQRNRYSDATWYSEWPGGKASVLAAQRRHIDRDHWPVPPRFSTPLAQRRAVHWYQLMRARRYEVFHAELRPFARVGWEWKAWRRRRNARPLGELAAYGYSLRWTAKSKYEGESFSQVVALASQPNYLGDIKFVRSLVENFMRLSIAYPGDDAPGCETLTQEQTRLGRVFASVEPGYIPVGSWNTRHGGLGAAIERAFNEKLAYLEEYAAKFGGYDPFGLGISVALFHVRDAARQFATNEYALKAIAGYTTAVLVGLYFEETFAEILRELESIEPAP